MQKARRHSYCRAPTACRRTVSGTISLPCSGCFSPFPHGTCSLSVSQEYLALPDGPGRFRQGFTCPALLRVLLKWYCLRVRGYHPLWPAFPKPFHFIILLYIAALQPRLCRNKTGLGFSHFARHYSGNHYCFIFLWVMRCFSSPRSLSIFIEYPDCSGWVAPFGYLRIDSYLPIPAAYRSLSRPSSPLRAKASSVRP